MGGRDNTTAAGLYPRRKCVLCSPGESMRAHLLDDVIGDKMKPCVEVMSSVRNQHVL